MKSENKQREKLQENLENRVREIKSLFEKIYYYAIIEYAKNYNSENNPFFVQFSSKVNECGQCTVADKIKIEVQWDGKNFMIATIDDLFGIANFKAFFSSKDFIAYYAYALQVAIDINFEKNIKKHNTKTQKDAYKLYDALFHWEIGYNILTRVVNLLKTMETGEKIGVVDIYKKYSSDDFNLEYYKKYLTDSEYHESRNNVREITRWLCSVT